MNTAAEGEPRMSKRITATYYDPKSRSIRLLSETSEQVGHIDTQDLADVVLTSLLAAVRDMYTDARVQIAQERAYENGREDGSRMEATMASEALQQAYDEGYRAVSGGDDTAHRLGRVHSGMRYCLDKGCNWGRPALVGER